MVCANPIPGRRHVRFAPHDGFRRDGPVLVIHSRPPIIASCAGEPRFGLVEGAILVAKGMNETWICQQISRDGTERCGQSMEEAESAYGDCRRHYGFRLLQFCSL